MTTETAIPTWSESLLRAIDESPLRRGGYQGIPSPRYECATQTWGRIDLAGSGVDCGDLRSDVQLINDGPGSKETRRELMRREVYKYLEEQGA